MSVSPDRKLEINPRGGVGASGNEFADIFAKYGVRSGSVEKAGQGDLRRLRARYLVPLAPGLIGVVFGLAGRVPPTEGQISEPISPPPPIVESESGGMPSQQAGLRCGETLPPPQPPLEPLPTPSLPEELPRVEIPKLGEIITVSGFSEGEGGRKVKEKRAIHSCEGEEGIWGVVWHQLVAKLVKTEEGEWYENFSQVCFTTVKEKGIYSPAQVLREWSVPKEKVEQAPQMLPRIYHDLRSGKAVSRDLASSEVAATTELGVGWSAHPVIVPHKEGFSVYYWASRNEQSEMPRIYRQNILPEGRLGSLFLEVGNGQAWRKFYPSAVVDEEGNHYVFWEQDYEERPGAFEIWAQKLDPNGEETGDSFPVSLMPYSQHPKAVLVDEEIWVSWEYPYIDNKGRAQIDVFCQRLTKEGELIRESFPIFQDGKDQNGVHEMAVNSYGEVVTVRAASDGKIWGRLMGENWMSEPQILAKEEGKLMVHAGVAPFGKEGFLISFYKFRPWESVFGQAYGLAVEVRNPGRGSLDEGQGVMKVDGWPIPPLDKKWLAVSPVFLLSSEIGQQFTSVSGGRDSAFFAWENRWDRVRNPDGSQILGRFATPGMFP